MTQDSKLDQAEVVLGKTHFQIPGHDELIAFSAEAIANDARWPEMQKAINRKLQSDTAADAA